MIDKNDIRFKIVLGEKATPSEVQIELCDFIAHKVGNATVESRAGSGKSKTIELMTHFIPKGKKVLIVCFNTHIADHLKKELKEQNVEADVMTYHSLGYKILLAKKLIDKKNCFKDDKYRSYVINNINQLNPEYEQLNSVEKNFYKKNLLKLIDYSRYNLMQSVKEINKVARKYGVNCVSNECEATNKVLKWGCNNTNEVDYQDMLWLPYELGIKANIPWLQYDFIFVDEAQDSSLAQQNLIDICSKRNTRFVAVGDSLQCINSWAGSDEEAFFKFNKKDNVKQFTLNTSYRCAKKIAELARTIVPDFNTPDWADEGEIKYTVSLDEIQPGDMVLCRLTSPLVDLHLQLISAKRSSKIKGLELGEDLKTLLNSFSIDDVNEIRCELEKNLINKWMNLAEENEISLKDAACENDIMILYDTLLTLNIISKGLLTKREVIERIDEVIGNNNDNDDIEDNTNIHLTTIHKAKGLENNRVFILCPSLMPSRLAHRDWEIKAEQNLIYVAYTRAKKSLNFISEKEFPPSVSYSGIDNMYNTLMKLKMKYETV